MNDEVNNDLEFVPLKIEVALKFNHLIDSHFFLRKPNQEFVKIGYDTKSLNKTLKGYIERGLKEIYLQKEDYEELLLKLQEYLSKQESLKEGFDNLSSLYQNVRHQMLNIGFNGLILRQAEEINRQIVNKLAQSPTLAEVIIQFKNNNRNEFYRYLTLSFVTSSMVETFPWKSNQIKLKVGLASMLLDISLSKEMYQQMLDEPDPTKWDDELRNHPLRSAQIYKKAEPNEAAEVIQMIEMHHEDQDGEGFPRGLRFGNIPLLPSIIIVGQRFVNDIEQAKFDKTKIDHILGEIYKKYTKGSFKQASLAIFKALGHQAK